MTQLITNYKNFDYNSDFIPKYNVFNINTDAIYGNVGINSYKPKNILECNDKSFFEGNLNINENVYFNTNISNKNFINILFYNKLLEKIDVGILKYSSPNKPIQLDWKIKNDSLILEPLDNKINNKIFYETPNYICKNSNFTTKIISKSIIFIKYICIYNLNNNNDYTQNITLKINNQTYNTINNLNGIFKLNYNYKLEKDIFYDFSIEGLQENVIIKIIGVYDYDAGSYWYNNLNSSKYINRKVLIKNNNNNSYDFFVDGNGYINNDLFSNKIKTNRLINKGNLKINGLLYTNTLQSNKNLDLECKNIYINSDSKDDYLCVLGNSKISNNGNFETNQLFIQNNLKLKQIQKFNSYNTINFNNNNLSIMSKYYEDYIIDSGNITTSPNINKTLLLVNNNNILFNSKVIITNKNQINNLNKNYDLYIDNYDINCESIHYKNLYSDSTTLNTDIKINNIKQIKTKTLYSDFSNLGNYGNIKNITCSKLDSDYINFLDNNNLNIKEGTIYYAKNKFYTTYKNNVLIPLQEYIQPKKINNLQSINTNILNTELFNSNELNTDIINCQSIKLPLVNTTNNLINNNTGLLKENDKLTISDGYNDNELLFNETDGYYILEYRYNKIKLDSQLTNILINPDILYNIKIENNKMIINQENIVFNDKNFTNKFYIKNNRIITNNNLNTYITIFNLEKIGVDIFRCDFKFDKQFDSETLIDVLFNKYDFTNKLYKISFLPNNTNHMITTVLPLATNTDLPKDKYKINNFQLYNINNSVLPIYLYNIIHNNNYLDVSLIHESKLYQKISMINHTLNIKNKSIFGYNLNYLNHNGIYKIKNSKIYTTNNINTDLVLINKRLNTGIITNNFKYT